MLNQNIVFACVCACWNFGMIKLRQFECRWNVKTTASLSVTSPNISSVQEQSFIPWMLALQGRILSFRCVLIFTPHTFNWFAERASERDSIPSHIQNLFEHIEQPVLRSKSSVLLWLVEHKADSNLIFWYIYTVAVTVCRLYLPYGYYIFHA